MLNAEEIELAVRKSIEEREQESKLLFGEVFQFGGLDDELMTMAAFRYCLGRRSYIVGACIDWLKRNWQKFTPNTQRVIVRDIVEALQRDEAGSQLIDVPGWRDLADVVWLCMPREDQRWLVQSVSHNKEPWPLSTDPLEGIST
jgi:hypothetical protein